MADLALIVLVPLWWGVALAKLPLDMLADALKSAIRHMRGRP